MSPLIFSSQNHVPQRANNLSNIPMDVNVLQKIQQIAYDNRLNWEAWIESAETYDELKNKLKKRGYTGIPMSQQPEVPSSRKVVNRVTKSAVMVQKAN
jgi:hypothetical protein